MIAPQRTDRSTVPTEADDPQEREADHLDLATNETRREKVFTGSVLALGADRYCVIKVEEGESELGAITLRKSS